MIAEAHNAGLQAPRVLLVEDPELLTEPKVHHPQKKTKTHVIPTTTLKSSSSDFLIYF